MGRTSSSLLRSSRWRCFSHSDDPAVSFRVDPCPYSRRWASAFCWARFRRLSLALGRRKKKKKIRKCSSNSTQSSPNSQPKSWQTPRLHTSLDLTAFSTSRFHRSLALQICCCKWPLRVSGLLSHWGTLSFYWYDFHTPEFLSLSYWFCPATAGEITQESLWCVTGKNSAG